MEFRRILICDMAQMNDGVKTRFSELGRNYSILLLLLVALAIGLSVKPALHMDDMSASAIQKQKAGKPDITNDDLRLYRLITARVANGEGYYSAAFAEHRANEYPTRPFVTVRLPTLAVLTGPLSHFAIGLAFAVIAIATLLVWLKKLDNAFRDPGRRITGVMLIASGLIMGVIPRYFVLHELWAGALIALSLGLYRPQNYWPSILAAAGALAVRETALPYVMLMAAFAIYEKRWREVMVWGLLLGMFAIGLSLHALTVNGLFLPSDVASPGWLRFGGLQSMIAAMAKTSALRIFPELAAALAIPLSLLGWMSWRSSIGARGVLYIAGFGFMLTIIGRAENFYWGLMIAPLLLLGLAFVPQALADVVHSIKADKCTAIA
jgi:hypothetical protein